MVPGVKFLYGGEVKSEAGDTYSDVQFLNIERLEYPTPLSDEIMNLQQHVDAILI